jgi:hypothetical protein
MKRSTLLLVAAVVALFAVACSDDSVQPTPCLSCGGKPLSKKSDVLNNIEYAYNKRNIAKYDELLDDNFTFFYTQGAVSGGGTPVQWGRPDELTTTSGLLAAADKVDLTIDWKDADGNATVQWVEQISGSETWYYTTAFYHFTIKIGDTTYIPNTGAKAQFTVRNAGTAEKPKWKLVEFRDLGASSLLNATSKATEPTTWGQVKAIYR